MAERLECVFDLIRLARIFGVFLRTKKTVVKIQILSIQLVNNPYNSLSLVMYLRQFYRPSDVKLSPVERCQQ